MSDTMPCCLTLPNLIKKRMINLMPQWSHLVVPVI